jgi:hypothetical protein
MISTLSMVVRPSARANRVLVFATTSTPIFFVRLRGRRGYGIFGFVLESTGRAGWTKAINERNPKHIYWMSFRPTISSIQRLGHFAGC